MRRGGRGRRTLFSVPFESLLQAVETKSKPAKILLNKHSLGNEDELDSHFVLGPLPSKQLFVRRQTSLNGLHCLLRLLVLSFQNINQSCRGSTLILTFLLLLFEL